MTDLPLGMKYYLLILTSSLIEDLNDYGVKWIANEPGIAIRDVEKAFFCARALESRMPDEPGQADPRLWPELMKSIHTIRRVLDVVEKTTFDAVIAEGPGNHVRYRASRYQARLRTKTGSGGGGFPSSRTSQHQTGFRQTGPCSARGLHAEAGHVVFKALWRSTAPH